MFPRSRTVALSLFALVVVSRPVAAQTPPVPAPAASDLDRAKELFRKGNELMKAGDDAAALDLFLQSRAIVPSIPNTMNAAICLDRLDRADEALEMYEALLTEFAGKLEESDRKAVGTATTGLRRRVGTVDVSANVEGTLVVDGRKRGSVPRTSPVPVRPGRHVVRVIKDGYAPAEAIVDVKAHENVPIDLRLEALAASGKLRVAEASGAKDLEVVVDGAPVGVSPWEGTLAPGRHLVWLRGKSEGTAPTVANVVVGQVVPIDLRKAPLGPPVRLDPEPRSARVSIDGVDVGGGPWDGRLPRGSHVVEASEEGYFTLRRALPDGTTGDVKLALEVDEAHPRWRALETPHVRVEALGGGMLGASMGGAPGVKANGFVVGARGAYVLPNGFQPELGIGYLALAGTGDRTVASERDWSYAAHDDLRVSGLVATAGLAYRARLGRTFRLLGRVTFGGFFAKTRDAVTANVVRGGETPLAANVAGSGSAVRSLDVFAEPEIGAEARFGHFHVGASFGVALFLLDGPKLPHGETSLAVPCQPNGTTGGTVPLSCTPGSNALASEQAFGRFFALAPQLSAGWTF